MPNRTILIIDDDRELCELVGELLRAEGFEVESRHTGAGAADRSATGGYARSSFWMSCCPSKTASKFCAS